MRGALDQPAGAVEKLVGHPFQRNAAVRASIFVNEYIGTLAHYQNTICTVDKAFAARIGQLIQSAQRTGRSVLVVIGHGPIIPIAPPDGQQQYWYLVATAGQAGSGAANQSKVKGQQMDAARRLRVIVMVLLGVLLALAILLSLALGAVVIPVGDTLRVLTSLVLPLETTVETQLIIEQIRLPRTLMGLLVGATLALTGAAMQGLFRNPLADPGLIGVSSGAALGVALILVLGGPWLALMPDALLPYATVFGAFIGGALTTWLVYRLGQSVQGTSVASMLLAGIAIAAISGAFIGLLSYLADDAMLRTLVFWNMGSLGSANFERVGMLALCCALVWWRLPRQAKALNALLLGESEARHLGIDVQRVKRELVLLTALGVGACVAAAGLIGFVGLVVPHLVRLMVGANHRYVLPASMLLGAGLLLLADVAARLVVAPAELPLGILTALLGAPFFLALLLRAQRNGGV